MDGRVLVMEAWLDELEKIASFSAPSIKAPSMPGGFPTNMKAQPVKPVTPKKIQAKALKSTTLQKTNYSTVQTKVPTPDISQTAEQKALTPPVVRS